MMANIDKIKEILSEEYHLMGIRIK